MQNTSIPGIATDCGNEENNPVVLQMPQDFLDLTEICPVSNTDPISEVPPSNRVEEDTTENVSLFSNNISFLYTRFLFVVDSIISTSQRSVEEGHSRVL